MLFDSFNVIHWPRAIEILLGRSVEPKVRKPVLALIRFDPVRRIAPRHLWSEVDVDRAVIILPEPLREGANLCALIISVRDHGTILEVVDRNGPELRCRWIGRDCEPVSISTVQLFSFIVLIRP